MASKASAVNWEVKHLVEATPISGPAKVYRARSEVRAMAESTTLLIARVRAPRALASFMAASVSAVSPLCEIPTTKSPGPTKGSR